MSTSVSGFVLNRRISCTCACVYVCVCDHGRKPGSETTKVGRRRRFTRDSSVQCARYSDGVGINPCTVGILGCRCNPSIPVKGRYHASGKKDVTMNI